MFDAATYTVEVSLVMDPQTVLAVPPAGKRYEFDVYAQEPMPVWGHQRDHTVAYALGKMPAAPPPDEDDESFEYFLHDSITLPGGIVSAAKQWHSQAGGSMPSVRFCRTDGPSSDTHRCPAGVNQDTVVAVANVVDEGDCDKNGRDGLACVNFTGAITSEGYIVVREFMFEHPTHVMAPDPEDLNGKRVKFPVKWVSRVDKDRKIINYGGQRMYTVYAKAIAMHEFGHLAGLDDLYNKNDLGFGKFLMYEPKGKRTVPDEDVRYLKQIYRNEHGAAPH